MAKVVWSETALNDLKDIVEYIAKDSQAYAERFGMRLIEAPRRLEFFPNSGRVVPEFDNHEIRELVYGSYRIIYLVRNNVCHVTAVIHASRNIIDHLDPGNWDVTS